MAIYTEQQIRLRAEFKNEGGALMDPGIVTLRIEKPDSTLVSVETTQNGVGKYSALYTPAEPGIYFVRWNGTTPLESALEETFYVESSHFSNTSIITIDQLLAAKGELRADITYPQMQRYEESINQASVAIRNYCDRSFGIPLKAETRAYEYEGTLLTIDDCWKLNKVFIKFGSFRTEVNSEYWRAEPISGPPFTYVIVPTAFGGLSPEMGFTKNLDVLVREQGWPYFIPVLEIEGEWGWATVPQDVQRAAILTAIDFAEVPQPYLSESIAGYNYALAARGPAGGNISTAAGLIPSALPSRAIELLENYLFPNI